MGGPALLVDDNPTVQRVIAAMLQRQGFEPLVAHDAARAIELARASKRPLALALLDGATLREQWPDLERKLRADARHRALPLVLTASAEVTAEGVVVLRKPFDPTSLQRAIREASQRPKAPPPSLRPPPSAKGPTSRPTLTSAPVVQEAPDPPALTPERLALLTRALLEHLGSRGWYELAELEHAAAAVLKQPPESLQDAPPVSLGVPREVLRGMADAVPLGELMQVLQMQMQTGVLEIRRTQGAEVKIFFRNGLIDLVIARGASGEFRMGRYLLEEGLIEPDALNEAVEASRSAGRLLGDVLIERGLISQEQLSNALMRQSSELIYEVLRWSEARYIFFREKGLPKNLDAQLGLPVASLVMEGFRRVDEWRIIEENLPPGTILLRDEAAIDRLGPDRLGRLERLILDQIDGQRSVQQILDAANASSFEGSKILYQFLQSRLARRRAS
jgi:CheY-like chemotaxis protein